MGTKYYLRITVYREDLEAVSDIVEFSTLANADAVQIKNIKVSNLTTSSARITFETSKPAKIVLYYGANTSYGSEKSSNEYLTTHSYDLSGLLPDTEYHFKIMATDEDSYITYSADQMFRTLEFGLPKNVGITDVSHDRTSEETLTITWKTTEALVCKLEYGETEEYGEMIENISPASGTSYLQNLGVEKDVIHYRVVCYDDDENRYLTRDYSYIPISYLPITGDEEEDFEYLDTIGNVATGLSLFALLLQLLNFLAQLGQIPKLGQLFGAIFDKDKKKKGWGVIFDLKKNRAIPFAIVRLYSENGSIKAQTVSDLNGRYHFIVEDGNYTIGVSHSDYILPKADSNLIKEYELTGKYLGGLISVKSGFSIAYDIPMISKAVAEEGKNKYWNLKDKFKVLMNKIGLGLNIIGGVFLILALVLSPNAINISLAVLDVLIIICIFIINSVNVKNWGYVYDLQNMSKVSGVFIRLFETEGNKLINTQISDGKGRYGFIADEGSYAVIIESPYYVQEKETPILIKKSGKFVKKNIGIKKVKDFPKDEKVSDNPFAD
jgi:hypothetical protein